MAVRRVADFFPLPMDELDQNDITGAFGPGATVRQSSRSFPRAKNDARTTEGKEGWWYRLSVMDGAEAGGGKSFTHYLRVLKLFGRCVICIIVPLALPKQFNHQTSDSINCCSVSPIFLI